MLQTESYGILVRRLGAGFVRGVPGAVQSGFAAVARPWISEHVPRIGEGPACQPLCQLRQGLGARWFLDGCCQSPLSLAYTDGPHSVFPL